MPRPGRFTPGRERQCSFYWGLVGPQGRYEQTQTISHPQGFDPQTVPIVAISSKLRYWGPHTFMYCGDSDSGIGVLQIIRVILSVPL
jgi:hypothetical protein